jgi:hypothetical protein
VLKELDMRRPLALSLIAIAGVFAMLTTGAGAQYIVSGTEEPYKPGRKFDEDGNPMTPGKRMQKPGINIDDNVLQPGRLRRPGREIDDATSVWDKPPVKSRHAQSEGGTKQKHSPRKPIEN